MNQPSRILILFIAFLFASCRKSVDRLGEAEVLLSALSSNNTPKNFGGFEGEAIAKLRDKQSSQVNPITFDVRKGDAEPPIGDGSCDYHAFGSVKSGDEPFIGIRLRYKDRGWHIVGYWTP